MTSPISIVAAIYTMRATKAMFAGRRNVVFISYRQSDSAPMAGWLLERLTKAFGKGKVFKDFATLRPGDDFPEEIVNAIASCEVLLVLIGDRWLTATDGNGQRRIDDPRDFVRLEIETGLKREKLVIPILIDDTPMPRPDELPQGDLRMLPRKQAVKLSSNRFNSDIVRLLETIKARI